MQRGDVPGGGRDRRTRVDPAQGGDPRHGPQHAERLDARSRGTVGPDHQAAELAPARDERGNLSRRPSRSRCARSRPAPSSRRGSARRDRAAARSAPRSRGRRRRAAPAPRSLRRRCRCPGSRPRRCAPSRASRTPAPTGSSPRRPRRPSRPRSRSRRPGRPRRRPSPGSRPRSARAPATRRPRAPSRRTAAAFANDVCARIASAFTPAGSVGRPGVWGSPAEIIVVVPPCRYESMKSTWSCRGVKSPITGCVWLSQKPGVTVAPAASITASMPDPSAPAASPT